MALNSVTPAHAGTLVTVLMFVAINPGATAAGVLAAAAVEKLFFAVAVAVAVAGVVVFLCLFLSVGGSLERKFGFLTEHPWRRRSPRPPQRSSSSSAAGSRGVG